MTDDQTPRRGSPPVRKVPSVPARRFSDEEVARILRAASELQERSAGPGGSRGLTLDDLRQVASEVGIDPRFIELAASDVRGQAASESNAAVGGSYAWAVHRTVPGEVDPKNLDRIIRAIRLVVGQKGEVDDVFGLMEWSYDDGLGPIMVGITCRDGVTEIDVTARRSGEVGLWFGLGVPMTGVLGGAMAKAILGMSAAGALPAIAVMAVVGWGGTRFLWSTLAKMWERKINRLSDAVTEAVAEVAELSGGALDQDAPTGTLAPPDEG